MIALKQILCFPFPGLHFDFMSVRCDVRMASCSVAFVLMSNQPSGVNELCCFCSQRNLIIMPSELDRVYAYAYVMKMVKFRNSYFFLFFFFFFFSNPNPNRDSRRLMYNNNAEHFLFLFVQQFLSAACRYLPSSSSNYISESFFLCTHFSPLESILCAESLFSLFYQQDAP